MTICTATKIYLVFTILTLLHLIIKNELSIVGVVLRVILFGIWAYVLSRLCTSGYKSVAMVGAIFPHILFILLTVRGEGEMESIIADGGSDLIYVHK